MNEKRVQSQRDVSSYDTFQPRDPIDSGLPYSNTIPLLGHTNTHQSAHPTELSAMSVATIQMRRSHDHTTVMWPTGQYWIPHCESSIDGDVTSTISAPFTRLTHHSTDDNVHSPFILSTTLSIAQDAASDLLPPHNLVDLLIGSPHSVVLPFPLTLSSLPIMLSRLASSLLALLSLALCCSYVVPSADFPWFDPTLSTSDRVSALIDKLTLREKVAQLTGGNNGVPRLGLPEFAWCSEGSHGVARAGRATVFPAPIALGATFDTQLVMETGHVLAEEARAKNNVYEAEHKNNSVIWYGVSLRHTHGTYHNIPIVCNSCPTARLTWCVFSVCFPQVNFFAPNINLFTHTRWGRGQETFTEDPYLSSRLAVAYVRGMQGDWGVSSKARYVQAGATCKHFFSYGSSNQTQLNNLWVDNTDLLQTYLPSFEACIREAKARSIMCSYSTINGYQMCQQPDLQRILRDEWRFDGFVTADDGAISLGAGANVTYKAAGALNAGCDMGGEFAYLEQALSMGLITEPEIDVALNRSLTVRVQLGKMDPPELVPWSSYNLSHVDTASSRTLARRAARESTVLLKNDYDYLPLSLGPSQPYSRSSRVAAPLSRIAVIGPNADRRLTLLGNYCGCQDGSPGGPVDAPITPSCRLVTPLQAIRSTVDKENANRRHATSDRHRAALADIEVEYNQGAAINSTDTRNFSSAVELAKRSDVVVAVMGIGTCVGPWGGLPADCIEAEAYDRLGELGLTGVQPQLMRQLIATGTPIILVLMSGSPLLINEWVASPSVPSILQHWYSGEEGGSALAELLFGQYSPSGKLPVTFPFSESQIPADEANYNMTAGSGRTYRYSKVIPLYSFGYGLSYTQFTYSKAANSILSPLQLKSTDTAATLSVTVQLQNTGLFDAFEVVELYVSYTGFNPPTKVQSIPRTELKAYKRVLLTQGASTAVQFNVSAESLRLVGPDGKLALLPGLYLMQVGGSAPGSRGQLVDGDDQHAGQVRVELPEGGLSAVCEGAARAWGERLVQSSQVEEEQMEDGLEQRYATVDVPFAINGGLSVILTVC